MGLGTRSGYRIRSGTGKYEWGLGVELGLRLGLGSGSDRMVFSFPHLSLNRMRDKVE